MRVRSAVARAGYKVAMTTQEGLNWSEDPLALKRTNVAEVDTLPEFVFKLATGRDLRQMTKAFLVRKGLYRAPEHAGQGGHRGGRDSDESTSEGPARVVIPPAPGPGQ